MRRKWSVCWPFPVSVSTVGAKPRSEMFSGTSRKDRMGREQIGLRTDLTSSGSAVRQARAGCREWSFLRCAPSTSRNSTFRAALSKRKDEEQSQGAGREVSGPPSRPYCRHTDPGPALAAHSGVCEPARGCQDTPQQQALLAVCLRSWPLGPALAAPLGASQGLPRYPKDVPGAEGGRSRDGAVR